MGPAGRRYQEETRHKQSRMGRWQNGARKGKSRRKTVHGLHFILKPPVLSKTCKLALVPFGSLGSPPEQRGQVLGTSYKGCICVRPGHRGHRCAVLCIEDHSMLHKHSVMEPFPCSQGEKRRHRKPYSHCCLQPQRL